MTPEHVVEAFNAAINARDIDALAALMTDDHEFVDTDSASVRGKDACVAAWRGFFAGFPDYRNTFTLVCLLDATVITVKGYSTCSVAVLNGPALWSARVDGERVAQWRVYADTPENRAALRIPIE